FQAEDGIRDFHVTGVQTCALPISRHSCALGSVKTNIGHSSAAAGVASLHKVLLCLQRRQLVPSLNFRTPNAHFRFENSPFYVCKIGRASCRERDENTAVM